MTDHIDNKILQILQTNAKVTNLELATQVNLSPTACLNRVRKLENAGIISGYQAIINPVKSGYSICALVLIKMSNNTRETAARFRKALDTTKAIKECHMTTGSTDYVARVYAKDFDDYEHIIQSELADLPNVGSLETLFLFKNLLPERTFQIATH